MKRICVYCGSSIGNNTVYARTAKEVGKFLASNGIELVYGGSNCGLMGIVSASVRDHGGKVNAIMPTDLFESAGHDHEHELEIVDSMHERKHRFFTLSDAFIALPGGFGTLDEMFEMLTWGQLGHHAKPCGFLNVNGYYSDLLRFMDNSVHAGFVSQQHHSLAIVADNISELFNKFTNHLAIEQKNKAA